MGPQPVPPPLRVPGGCSLVDDCVLPHLSQVFGGRQPQGQQATGLPPAGAGVAVAALERGKPLTLPGTVTGSYQSCGWLFSEEEVFDR